MGQKVAILHEFQNSKPPKMAREPLVPPAETHLQIRQVVKQRVLSVFLRKIQKNKNYVFV